MVVSEESINTTVAINVVYIFHETYTTVLLRTFGVVSFLFNSFAFVYIKRLIKSQKRENAFFTQLAFICANDCGCGLFIIFLSIPVTEVATVYICGVSFIIVNTLTCMAQGNIFFICLQRYVFARNVRSSSIKWKALLSKTLFAVNGIIGIVALSFYLYYPLDERYRASECTLGVYKDNHRHIASMLIFVGLPTMLASDVLCFLSILKLSRAGATVAAGGNDTSIGGQSSSVESNSVNFNKNQKRAITTIVIILVFFNLSVAPSFVRIFLSQFKLRLTVEISRLLVFCIYGNSIANPIIYITRIQDLRLMVVKDLSSLKQYLST